MKKLRSTCQICKQKRYQDRMKIVNPKSPLNGKPEWACLTCLDQDPAQLEIPVLQAVDQIAEDTTKDNKEVIEYLDAALRVCQYAVQDAAWRPDITEKAREYISAYKRNLLHDHRFEAGIDDEISFLLSNGHRWRIDGRSSKIVHTINHLDTADKMIVCGISVEQMATTYLHVLESRTQDLLDIIKKGKMHWRETGDSYDLNDPDTNELLFGLALTKREIVNQIRKGKIPLQKVLDITSSLTSGFGEIYIPERYL